MKRILCLHTVYAIDEECDVIELTYDLRVKLITSRNFY